jgi:predicted membrane channel-forming protein YqfA (hemolysin III family)
MRTFLSLLFFAVGINVIFAITTMIFFPGEIENAKTFIDYFFYAVGSLTTGDIGDHTPKTKAVKLWTSAYVLTAWVYIFYATINHITDVKFRLFG